MFIDHYPTGETHGHGAASPESQFVNDTRAHLDLRRSDGITNLFVIYGTTMSEVYSDSTAPSSPREHQQTYRED